jgi:hypothetical protein
MPKWLGVTAGLIVFLVALGWLRWHYSPMREIERSREAVAAVKSWHFHSLRHIAGIPPDTYDVDIVCPLFQHTITSSTRPDGTPLTYEYIKYSGQTYNHVGDQWILNAGTEAQNNANASRTVPIVECTTGPVGADLTSLPYSAMLDGSVRRGEYRTVEDGACRDYNVTVSTPHDPVENEFQFSICINEEDHLPRETRHTLQGASQETVSRYSKWGVLLVPPHPPDIPN